MTAWPFDRPRVARGYLRGVLIALDRFGNALLGRDCDLTISQESALRTRQGSRVDCLLCRVLGWFVPDHCEESLRGATLPPP